MIDVGRSRIRDAASGSCAPVGPVRPRNWLATGLVAAMLVVVPATSHAAQQLLFLSDPASYNEFGRSIADDVDWNGDGWADLVVGVPSASVIRVYFGGPGYDGVADVILSGIPSLGRSVRRLPDISGDGIDEIVSGATSGGSDERVAIFFGGPSPDATADVVIPSPGAPPPPFPNMQPQTFGFSVACGDVNGDDVVDLVVGAYGYTGGSGIPRGRAYVYFGSPGFAAPPNLTLTGASSGDYFGTAVAVGDVTGDGHGDLLVSAPYEQGNGRIHVYHGGPGIDITSDRDLVPGGGSLGDGDNLLTAEMSGDGIPDVVAGGTVSNRVDIYFGGVATTAPNLSLTGQSPIESFGCAIAVGDFCGDASPDLLVGAPQIGQPVPGKAYVFMGGPCIDNVPEDVLVGTASDKYLGIEVANVGTFLAGKDHFALAADLEPVGTGASVALYAPDPVPAPPAPPVVTAQPLNVVAAPGSSNGFSVFASGPGLTYTWRKNGVPIPGAPNARYLLLTNIQASDAGSYDVQVCNGCKCVSSQPATLQVCPLANATIPNVVRAAVGDATATIQATATAAMVPLYWMYGKTVLANGAKYSGVHTTTLTITSPVATDVGEYVLVYTGACGEQRFTNFCKFTVSPCSPSVTITSDPVSQTVSLGSPASFSIQATGCVAPTYRWQRWSDAARSWLDVPGANAATFVIPAVTAGDIGSYRCVATAPSGSSAISNPATLNQLTPKLLTVTSNPFGCGLALVSWTTSMPMTGVVHYGNDCLSLNQSTAPGPLGTSGSAILDLTGAAYAAFKVVATTPQNEVDESKCGSAFFQSTLGNLGVKVVKQPYYGDLYASGDGIVVRIMIANTGCTPIPGPITLTALDMNGMPPRRTDHSIDLPRDLNVAGLGIGMSSETVHTFSKTEVGLPSRSSVTLNGTAEYGTPPQRVSFSAKLTLP